MDQRNLKKNHDIEVLRAIAISFTLISHLVWGIMPKLGGVGRQVHSAFQFWTGVDLFFAISGFLITTSLLTSQREFPGNDPAAPRSRWRDFPAFSKPFWIRRAFRLLPSAWLWVSLTLVGSALFNAHESFGPLHQNLREACASLLNVANLYYYEWFSRGNSADGSFGIYWSLSLEEQFYLLFPFLLFFLRRRVLVAVLVAAFLAQVFVDRPSGFHAHSDSFLWFVRTDALILGVLIALWRRRRSYAAVEPRFLRRPALAFPFVGAAVVLLAAMPAFAPTSRFATGIVAVLSGALVLIASYNRDYIFPRSPVKGVFVWLGSRSYSIYLIHIACRAFVLELKQVADIAQGSVLAALWTVFSVVLTLLLSELNYRFIETPFRKWGHRLAREIHPHRAGESLAPAQRAATD